MACRVVAAYGGVLPCDAEILRSFRGVGPKCANLVLGIACQQPSIGVDIHVHRVTNRWGYVSERTPERTMLAPRSRAAAAVLGGDQPSASAVWQAYLHGQPTALLYLPGARHAPATRVQDIVRTAMRQPL